ncbi:MAG: hypothetical protein ACK49V_12415, partial [Actinomycetes bacterium]
MRGRARRRKKSLRASIVVVLSIVLSSILTGVSVEVASAAPAGASAFRGIVPVRFLDSGLGGCGGGFWW